MAHDWNIKPRGSICSGCEKVFRKGEGCVSAIFQEPDGFIRRDYCLSCWDHIASSATPFSLWQGVYAPSSQVEKKDEPIKHETAEELLRRLIMLDDPANVNVAYILAVMLERKKQLVERDSKPREGGGVYRFYEHKASGDTFVILDPQLRLDEIADVQKQVIGLLGG